MFRKICEKLHLFLGLSTGIVVFVVCITGALYVFRDEITDFRSPWRFVVPKVENVNNDYIYSGDLSEIKSLSEVIDIANKVAGKDMPNSVVVGCADETVRVNYSFKSDSKSTDMQMKRGQKNVFVNPYSGEVIKVEENISGKKDFFRFLLEGHRSLWLPRDIGSPIVAYSVLLFFIVLVSGVVIWLPKAYNLKNFKSRLTFKRPFKPFRFIYDFHRTLGIYVTLPLIIMAFTGMIFSLSWFSDGLYNVLTKGKGLEETVVPKSVVPDDSIHSTDNIDVLYHKIITENPKSTRLTFTIPTKENDAYKVTIRKNKKSHHSTDYMFYDRYTLDKLDSKGVFSGRYEDADAVHKFRRMNLALHDGRIFGLTGKIVMFLSCIVGAMLPITGITIWLKKEKSKQKNKKVEK